MKKSLFFAIIFSFLLFQATLVMADISVNYPTSFSLKLHETATVTNYQNMKIEFKSVETLVLETYPPQERIAATIFVSTAGGCGPNAGPGCLGPPGFASEYKLSAGASASALGLEIKVLSITSESASLEIKLSSGSDGDTPVVPPSVEVGGGISGDIQVCSNENNSMCLVCSGSECLSQAVPPSPQTPSSEEAQPPIMNLSEGEVFASVEKTDNSNLIVKTKKSARLFFFIPVQAEITYSVNSQTGASVVVKRPWWSFLARY